jgi:hypothetical protein
MMVLRIAKPWGFCDLPFWLCGRIGCEWRGKEGLGKSFPTHQRTLDFIERIKSYDRFEIAGVHSTIFGDGFLAMSIGGLCDELQPTDKFEAVQMRGISPTL